MATTLAVLDASLGETPAERNLRRELDATVDVYKVSDGEFPPPVAAADWHYDGIVVSGSQTSVYDDYEWIHELTAWFRQAHRADVPTLGICWGHQFVAQALGGRVVDMDEHELGYERIDRLGADPLFDGVPETFTSFETHHDRVAELPAGATMLARNEVGIQAFRVGTAYGVQFHPEYDRETAEWVIGNKDLADDERDALLAEVTDDAAAAADSATRVFDNFVPLAADHQPTVRGPTR
jgi:GMP synthase (glutamine-hydrolysing)